MPSHPSKKKRSGGGVISTISRAFMYLMLAGLIIALLRVFNWDPFGVMEWLWSMVMGVVLYVSDWFSGNETFREITRAPAVLGRFIS